jgi:hypothetical protein
MDDQLRAYREAQARRYQREHQSDLSQQPNVSSQTSRTTTVTTSSSSNVPSNEVTGPTSITHTIRTSLPGEFPRRSEQPTESGTTFASASASTRPVGQVTSHDDEDHRNRLESDMEFARQLHEAELRRRASSTHDSLQSFTTPRTSVTSSRQSQEELDAIIAQQLQEMEAAGEAPENIDDIVESIASRHRQSMESDSLSQSDVETEMESEETSSIPAPEFPSSPHTLLLNLLQRHLGVPQIIGHPLFGSEFPPFFSHPHPSDSNNPERDIFRSMFEMHRSLGRRR